MAEGEEAEGAGGGFGEAADERVEFAGDGVAGFGVEIDD